jgi:DNA polymerase-3 subunit alpha
MKWVELAGLVKFDFLGLKTLDVLHHAVELLNRRGVEIDLANLPLDDAKTYELISRGDTTGVFQLESAGMRDSLRKLKPNRFEDIVAMNALYRPGPMESIPKYIKCKNGEEPVYYPHPLLEPILKDTFGVFTYQEQVMQAAQLMAGYSLGSADLLRRAMGKKNASEMSAQRGNFVTGALQNGIDDERANLVFDLMEKFSGYGFNKSHSAPYALIAYQTAYLKANYPVEFLAASMTLDMGNTDKLNQFRQEADRLGIRLLPPDVNRSQPTFSVEEDPKSGKPAIRYALAAVKGVGAQAMQVLVGERDRNGRFKDLFDLAQRLDAKTFNRGQFESLTKAGAFDPLDPNRAQTFAAAELLLRQANRAASERQEGQGSLFGLGLADRPALPLVDDWPPVEKLQQEFAAIGFYLSSHPLDAYGRSLERAGILRTADLPSALAANSNTRFRLAGIVVGRKERTSARGNRFAFVQMSDPSGLFEVTLFAEMLREARPLFESGQPLVVTVDVRSEEDSLRLSAQKIEPLDEVVAHAAAGMRVFLGEERALAHLKNLFGREGAGRGRVSVVLDLDDSEVEIAIPGGFRVDPRMRAAVKSLPGVVDVHDI